MKKALEIKDHFSKRVLEFRKFVENTKKGLFRTHEIVRSGNVK